MSNSNNNEIPTVESITESHTGDLLVTRTDGTVQMIPVKSNETVTAMRYDSVSNTMAYTDETGAITTIDLTASIVEDTKSDMFLDLLVRLRKFDQINDKEFDMLDLLVRSDNAKLDIANNMLTGILSNKLTNN